MEIWIDLISKGGIVAGLVLFVWGLKQRWWVMGAEYEEMRSERDYERERADVTADVADDAAREVVKRASPPSRQRRSPGA